MHHDDSFVLKLRAFNQTFALHLEPNDELVHPDGMLVRYDEGRTEWMAREEIRAYRGVVVDPRHSDRRRLEDEAGIWRRSDVSGLELMAQGVLGRASILMHDDGVLVGRAPSFEGTFSYGGDMHTIQLARTYSAGRSEEDPLAQQDGLVLHRRSDIRQTEQEAAACGSDAIVDEDSLELHGDEFWQAPRATFSPFESDWSALRRRQSTGSDIGGAGANTSYEGTIGSTAGCPNSARVVYVGVAADCTYSSRFQNEAAVRTTLLNNMNTVSNLYRTTFNISLGVVELNVQSSSCPSTPNQNVRWNQGCSNNYPLDQRLSDFSAWRGSQPANGTGLWHLMTACGAGQSGGEVGIAWLGTVCQTDANAGGSGTVSGTGVSSMTTRDWQVMAHEMGHNFGAIHDCQQNCRLSGSLARQSSGAVCCPSSTSTCFNQQNFIMDPVSAPDASVFSSCTVGNICSLLGRGLGSQCIVQPGQRTTLSAQQCGNGILEPGEECDAGPDGSNCCSRDCKLTSGSLCDPQSSTCCTSSCRYAPSSQVCRPAVDNRCDTSETCSGTSADCPADTRQEDGASCGSNGLVCASGHCTSRDLQCQEQGAALNVTSACPLSTSGSCNIACVDPRSSGSGSCLILQQTFIDGTACGYGGHCSGGQCESGGWQATFRNWYTENLRISIPVTIIIAIIVIGVISLIVRCCIGRRSSKRAAPSKRFSRQSANGVPGGQQQQRYSHARNPSQQQQQYPSEMQHYAPPVPARPAAAAAPYDGGYGASHHSRQPSNGAWVPTSNYNGY